MPTLEWIGKSKVINHHQDVPFRVLERKYSFDENGQTEADNGSENMIIHGDNLEALKALLPRYEGRVKCIYIDPPYNTGNEGWVYNDNVNDPKIKKWLGEVVGKEGEDLSRHDKWLCMMYPRLKLLQKLCSPDGCIAISIGIHEINNLLAICQELFSTKQIMPVTVKTSGGKPSGAFNVTHEYIVFILPKEFKANPSALTMNSESSPYHSMTLASFYQEQRPNQTYPIYIDESGRIVSCGRSLQELIDSGEYTGEKKDYQFDYDSTPYGTTAVWPVSNKGLPCVWRQIAESTMKDWEKGYIKVIPQKSKKTKNKWSVQFLSDGIKEKIENGTFSCKAQSPDCPTLVIENFTTAGVTIPTIWDNKGFYTAKGTELINALFNSKTAFTYAKPIDLICEIFGRISGDNDLILDSFAGSATSAHAVLNLNKRDEGNRKFILVEMGEYANSTTAERVKRVISGYRADLEEVLYDEEITTKNLSKGADMLSDAKLIAKEAKNRYAKVTGPKIEDGHLRVVGLSEGTDEIEGTGGNFSYYELGEPLLIGDCLNENVGVEKIREYVWFMETKAPYAPEISEHKYYLGKHNDTGYYFYYDPQKITVLDYAFLATITEKNDGTIIYADRCAIGEDKLNQMGIVFKKIPRDISRL